MNVDKISCGILTVSDSCFRRERKDESGPNLVRLIESGLIQNGVVAQTALVADDITEIEKILKDWCDKRELNLVLTTGGTGLGPRDVTPEAMSPLLDKTVPGISQLIFKHSSEITPYAALSRCLSGVRGKSLIITLPGSKKASQECLEAVHMVIPHAVDLICNIKNDHLNLNNGNKSKVNPTSDREKVVYPLVSVSEAQKIILDRLYLLKKEKSVPFKEALGCVLAEEVVASDCLPSYDASLKDGYAVVSSDPSITRKIVGNCNNDTLNSNIKIVPGVCAKINTGAALPSGADAIIPIEHTQKLLTPEESIRISSNSPFIPEKPTELNSTKGPMFGKSPETLPIVVKYPPGNEVRFKGSDYKMGELLLEYGTYLNSSAVGLLAAAGITSVKVFAKPKVVVFSTGNELVNPGDYLPKGKVRDSNRITLISLLEEEGFSASDLGIIRDEPDVIFSSLRKAFSTGDVVVTSGSMSMGDKDYMKEIITTDFESEICFGRVSVKPGKPTAFAIVKFEGKTKLWFGLPGNPASAFVTSHLFLLPALRKIAGYKNVLPPSTKAILTFDIIQEDRAQYHRAILSKNKEGKLEAITTGNQGSSRIGSCVYANCLLEIPKGSGVVSNGSTVNALLITKNITFTVEDTI